MTSEFGVNNHGNGHGNGKTAGDMIDSAGVLQAIRFSRNSGLELLDQRVLPFTESWHRITNAKDAHDAIKSMLVRGAPAIGVTAALGMAVEILDRVSDSNLAYDSPESVVRHVEDMRDLLNKSRPTAVNLFDATDRLSRVAKEEVTIRRKVQAEGESDTSLAIHVAQAVIDSAEQYMMEDIESNKTMGQYGADAIFEAVRAMDEKAGRMDKADRPLKILTHCNTGSLATAGYGTALGVIRSIHKCGRLGEAISTETRPYNQGGRLTVYELCHDGLNAKLITDSTVPTLMAKGGIDAVVVGADRIAANGDSANKIGTYSLAIAAKYHGIPFFIAAPLTTVDLKLANGNEIPIEERSHTELTHSPPWLRGVAQQRIVAEGVSCWNPAFDVAPTSLITGIITEKGVAYPTAGGVIDMKAFVESCTMPLQTESATAPRALRSPFGFEALNEISVLKYVASIESLKAILGEDSDVDNRKWSAKEVGDGNINFVYIISGSQGTIVVKQALPYVRCVGEEWPLECSRISYEADALRKQYECCPEHTPKVFHFDPSMALLAMEYVPQPSQILRYGLIQGRVYPHLAVQMAEFCANTLFKTSLLCLSTREFRTAQQHYCGNVEMCRLTEQVIFTDPYFRSEMNRWTSPQLDDIARALTVDGSLKKEVSILKRKFCELSQSLLHGDLHTGSIMTDDTSIKVIDPEFAFYGPMGFDLGAFVANLLLNFFSIDGRRGSSFTVVEKDNKQEVYEFRQWIVGEIVKFWNMFRARFLQLWAEQEYVGGTEVTEMKGLEEKRENKSPAGQLEHITPPSRQKNVGDAFSSAVFPSTASLDEFDARGAFMKEIFADMLGFAGCKMIRRIVGIAHVSFSCPDSVALLKRFAYIETSKAMLIFLT